MNHPLGGTPMISETTKNGTNMLSKDFLNHQLFNGLNRTEVKLAAAVVPNLREFLANPPGETDGAHPLLLWKNGKLSAKRNCLVGGLEHDFYDFPYIWNVIIPTDQYFSEGLKPPTSCVCGLC